MSDQLPLIKAYQDPQTAAIAYYENPPDDGRLYKAGDEGGAYLNAISPQGDSFSVKNGQYFNKDAAENTQPSVNSPVYIEPPKPNPIGKIIVFGALGFFAFKLFRRFK